MQILQYSPGQRVTLALETFDSDGYRADGYELPAVTRIIFPDLSVSAGFPQGMLRLDTGLYYFRFTLPSNASSVGSYLIDIAYVDPTTSQIKQTLYQVIVTAPFGVYSATVG